MSDDKGEGVPAIRKPDEAADRLVDQLASSLDSLAKVVFQPGVSPLFARVGPFKVTRDFAVGQLLYIVQSQNLADKEKEACKAAIKRAAQRLDLEKDDNKKSEEIIRRLVQLVREELSK